ncbi:MAG: BACON domain-containing protein [Bacteroidales bacterium]|nr:BACON domain-containing protein [Bacteroidales bacterium]
MKKILLFSLCLALASFFFSCSRQEVSGGEAGESRIISLEPLVADEDGKTYLDASTVKWGTGEYIMMYYNDGSDKFAKSLSSSADAANGNAQAAFDFSISPATASSYRLGGVYPYSAVKSTASAKSVTVRIPSAQKATASAYDPSSFIMVLMPQQMASIPAKWSGYFRRASALNCINISGVSEPVYKVDVSAPGCRLSGERGVDLSTGESNSPLSGDTSVSVSYATPLSGSSINVWFCSWGAEIPAGSTLTIKLYGETKTYTRSISATGNGIRFCEGKLNKLGVDFSSATASGTSLRDFAKAFSAELSVWNSNTATNLTVGDISISGKYIPANRTFKVGNVSYSKTAAYDVAIKGLDALLAGATLDSALPAAGSYAWGTNPYNEGDGNGGVFQNLVVDLNFLRNYNSREKDYAQTNSRWSNLCSYTDKDGAVVDRGTPSVAGQYKGCCCLERNYLIMARFYKYLLDNNISRNIESACSSMKLSAGLFDEVTISNLSGSHSFTKAAGSWTAKIYASGNWTAKASASWISLSPASGSAGYNLSLTVTVTANSGTARTGTVTLSCGGKTATISISQAGNVTYWSKYGVSSDGTKIMAIGRPSAGNELSTYGYYFYKSVFKRVCPHCGSDKLYWGIFWAGNETSNWGTFPATGNGEGGSAEGHIFCAKCDADYSCIQGREHVSNGKVLTRVSGPTKVTKDDAYTLKNGKMPE